MCTIAGLFCDLLEWLSSCRTVGFKLTTNKTKNKKKIKNTKGIDKTEEKNRVDGMDNSIYLFLKMSFYFKEFKQHLISFLN